MDLYQGGWALLLTVTGLECVWWLAAGEEENDHENREQQSTEHTEHTRRALHVWAKGRHRRAALAGGGSGQRAWGG